MTSLVYKGTKSPVIVQEPTYDTTHTKRDYPDGFDIRNPASLRKLAVGLGASALLLIPATPTGREAALNVGNAAYGTVSNMATVTRHGEAGIMTYTPVPIKLQYETTPRNLAEKIAGDGDISREIRLADLIEVYLTRKNKRFLNAESKIPAGATIMTLVSDPQGPRLGNLVDALDSQ